MIRHQLNSPYANILIAVVFLLIALGIAVVSTFYPMLVVISLGLVVGSTAVLFVTARWPETFLLLALWTNFMKSAYIPGLVIGEFGATPHMIFTTLATIGFGVQILTGKRRLLLPPGLWFLLLFLTFTTISLLIAQDFRIALGAYARGLLNWMLFFSLIQMLTDRQRLRKLITMLLAQALVLTTWGIIAGLQLEITGASHRTVFFWQQYQKNDFAAYLGLVLVLALATYSVTKSRWKKLVAVELMIVVPVCWMVTFSRGGFLAILTCLFVFLVLERNKKLLRRSLLAALLVGFLGLLIVALAPGNIRNLAVTGLQSLVTGESEVQRHTDTIGFRLELAKAGIEVIAAKPILGVGYNQWQFYSPLTTRVYDPQTDEFRETGYSIHNRFLLIAANNGLLALLGYIGFLTAVLIYGLWQRRTAAIWVRIYLHAFLAVAVGMQVAMLFAPSVIWEWPIFASVIGFARVANAEKQHQIKADLSG